MLIEIFDVGHGQSALITCPNGRSIVIDAAFPLKGLNIGHLITTNLDEDHLSALPEIARNNKTEYLWWNFHINASRLQSMKLAGMGRGVELMYGALLENWLLNIFVINSIKRKPLYYYFYEGDVKITLFANPYEWFQDTNNLSLVVFIQYGAFCIMFPGDVEKAGWKSLLQYQEFMNELSKVTAMLASHHGRENGYFEEVFNYCKPALIIVSDKEKIHETQEAYNQYSSKVFGCRTIDGQQRNVMSTRKDGHISLAVNLDATFWYASTEVIERKYSMGLMQRLSMH